MQRISIISVLGICRTNFLLAVKNNLFLAAVYLLIIPLLRGIANLDMVRSAECLEQAVILTGVFLIAPLPAPEQSKAIQGVVCTKKIPHWKILLLRFIMSMLLLILIVCLFSGIMVWKNCIFPFMPYVAGTVISAMALGSFGFAAAIFSNSVIVGYLASIGYFLLNSLGNVSEDSIFYLFSMGKGNYSTKIWLFGLSLLVIAVVFIYERRKRY